MVSAATKRKRRERENRTAALIEQARQHSQAERKALGTEVTQNASDELLFREDRKGETKESLRKKYIADGKKQLAESKKARRANPKPRRSEAAAVATPMEDITVPGRKKQRTLAPVEKAILTKREFDLPEGHVGNKSEAIRKAKLHADGKEDVWNGDVAKMVEEEITDSRKDMVRKLTRKMRRAPAVLYPGAGLSVNPSYEHHQDMLGEALARVVEQEDHDKWVADKLSFDPALLEEPGEEEAITGMKLHDPVEATNENGDMDTFDPIARVVPERKTRTQRNKESRKREMQSNILKKRAAERQANDLINLTTVAKDALVTANKLHGITKKEARANRPRGPPRRELPVVKKIAKQRVRNERIAEPLTLSKDVSDSLRSAKMPRSNPMLHDRLLSFERRGMVEPPNVLPKEVWRMQQEARQEERRDKRKRKGRHSKSNISFWKERSLKN